MARPPKFQSKEELEAAIDKYFSQDYLKKSLMPSKAGLRLYLGICKDTYSEWKKEGNQFSDSIKKADDLIEVAWIDRLAGNTPTGAIFYLKNAFKDDYKDKQEMDMTSGGEKISGFNYVKPGKEDNVQADG